MLGQVRLREEPVALMVADQRMPQMTGVEFLERALEVAPDAKRVLLTAYADTQAAIDAINKVALDHYLLKPWDPPEEQLYPVLDDLLADWQAGAPPRAGGAGDRPPLLARVARAEGLPGAQQRAVPLAGRRAGPRGAGAAGRGGRRRGDAAGAGAPRRRGDDRAVQPRRSPTAWGCGRAREGEVLRPGGGRRRARRAGGGGVRRVRGAAHGAGGARGAGRPGRGRARGSRTTSASPWGCRAPT